MFRVLSLFALLLCAASPAGAAGVVTLSWDGCTGPVTKTVLPGSQATLFASVIGHSEAHQGYHVRLVVGTSCAAPGAASFPDAWRFEDGGCQPAGAFRIDDLAPAEVAATCPSFRPSSLPALIVKRYSFDAATGRATIDLASVYQDGVAVVNPGQRYFLGRFVFDQGHGIVGPSSAGFCGGLETPLCIQPTDLLWLNASGDAISWLTDTACLTVNDPGHTVGCNNPTPARATTWGAIRGQYR